MKLLNELVTGYSCAFGCVGSNGSFVCFFRADATVEWHALRLTIIVVLGTDDDGERPACVPLFCYFQFSFLSFSNSGAASLYHMPRSLASDAAEELEFRTYTPVTGNGGAVVTSEG